MILTWKDIFTKALKHKKMLFWANVVAIIATLANVPTPIFMPILVDEVILHKPGFFIQSVDHFFSGCSPVCYVMIALGIVIFLRFAFYVLNVIQNKIFITISKSIVFEIRSFVLQSIGKTSLSAFENTGSGKIASMLVSDINTIDEFLGVSISRLVISILTVIGVGAVLLMIHFWLGLFIIVLNPVIVILSSRFARAVSEHKKAENASIAHFSDKLSEALDIFWQIKASNKASVFSKDIVNYAEDVKNKSIAFNYKSDKSLRFSYLIFLVGFEVFRAVAIITVFYSDLSIGLMLAIFGYLWVMMTPVQEILNIQYAYQNASRALSRINELIALEKEPEYEKQHNPFERGDGVSIEIKRGSFAHNDGVFSMQEINFLAQKNEITAIVGASGSGKSTLAHLLVGFYHLHGGKLLIDGIDIKQIGLEVLRENLFLVLQSPFLINGTLRENLTFGDTVDDEILLNALKVAKFLEVFETLPDGFETRLGKNGVRLSGGQRQRVAIARMIVKDPKVVIFDESTSALDVDTEALLFEELEPFLKNKTVIIIAHRLSTIKNAHTVYEIKDSQITRYS